MTASRKKILIDHGSQQNLGDKAMLFNIVQLVHSKEFSSMVVDRKISFAEELTQYNTNLVPDPNLLSWMSHWRLKDYKTQPRMLRPLLRLLIWIILFLRARQLKSMVISATPSNKKTDNRLTLWADILRKSDAFWVAGGGNLNDLWIENTFWKATFAEIFKAQNKPVIFSGQGIGPINHWFTKLMIKKILKNASMLGVRESITHQLLKPFGNIAKKCQITYDDALNTQAIPFEINLSSKFIALNVRLSDYAISEKEQFQKYCQLIRNLIALYPEHSFIFVPIALNEHDSDILAAERLIKEIPEHHSKFIVMKDNLNAGAVKHVLSAASLSVGVSYHFCLFSLSAGTPTIGIYNNAYYKQKLVGLFNLFGLENCVLDLNADHAAGLSSNMHMLFKNFNKSVLLNTTEKMLQKQAAFFNQATTLIAQS